MAQVPSIDTDLYVVHTLIVASTIHLHFDHVMDLKMSWAANRVVELIQNLTIGDFQFLDPVLAVSASSILSCCLINCLIYFSFAGPPSSEYSTR